MKFVLLLAFIMVSLPYSMQSQRNSFKCDMPRQFFGGALLLPSNAEQYSNFIAVDLDKQRAVFMTPRRGYWDTEGYSSHELDTPASFQLFDYKARKSYTVNENKRCSVETIDSRLTFPAVNPSVDPGYRFGGSSYAISIKGDLALDLYAHDCTPRSGSLVQVKWNIPILMRYNIYEYSIEDTRVLWPNISMCSK